MEKNAACTKITTEEKKGIGQKYRKRAKKDCLIFDGWLSSNKAEEAAMEVGAQLVCIVKTNTKGFFKENIEKLTNYWSGGSYLVLRSNHMVPRGRLLIAIGYKYNVRKVIYFIVTDNTWITQEGLPYLSKYSDKSNNVSIFPVACPLVMYKFFGSVN